MIETRVCNECGRAIEPNETSYRVHLSMFAEPNLHQLEREMEMEPPTSDEWEDLIRRMQEMSDEEGAEASDQIHETFSWVLCPECRQQLHDRIKRHKTNE